MSTQYHVAVVVYKSSSPSKQYVPLYEESITLIKAKTGREAKARLEKLIEHRRTTFMNQAGQNISWDLLQIIDISPMLEDRIGEVTEVYGRHFQNIDAYNAFEILSE